MPAFGPGSSYHPRINPADFSPNVTNPLFPLVPEGELVYSGTKDEKSAEAAPTTSRTKVIDGVTTRVVEDRLYLDNVLEERTSDYCDTVEDRRGMSVLWRGHAMLDEQGHVVSREGSFHAGVKGAQPGVFMQAKPQLGRKFRQEWFRGHAEDVFKAISLSAPITVPYGTFHHALRTAETTALEPRARQQVLRQGHRRGHGTLGQGPGREARADRDHFLISSRNSARRRGSDRRRAMITALLICAACGTHAVPRRHDRRGDHRRPAQPAEPGLGAAAGQATPPAAGALPGLGRGTGGSDFLAEQMAADGFHVINLAYDPSGMPVRSVCRAAQVNSYPELQRRLPRRALLRDGRTVQQPELEDRPSRTR